MATLLFIHSVQLQRPGQLLQQDTGFPGKIPKLTLSSGQRTEGRKRKERGVKSPPPPYRMIATLGSSCNAGRSASLSEGPCSRESSGAARVLGEAARSAMTCVYTVKQDVLNMVQHTAEHVLLFLGLFT